ncbi:TnpA family transposase [Lysinibacillus sp. RC46]
MFTPEQRQALMRIPEDEWVLGTYYTFSKRDLEIINKRRREENRLGFAVQLAVLRYPGGHTLISKASRIHSYIIFSYI